MSHHRKAANLQICTCNHFGFCFFPVLLPLFRPLGTGAPASVADLVFPGYPPGLMTTIRYTVVHLGQRLAKWLASDDSVYSSIHRIVAMRPGGYSAGTATYTAIARYLHVCRYIHLPTAIVDAPPTMLPRSGRTHAAIRIPLGHHSFPKNSAKRDTTCTLSMNV